ncbi:MAG: zinc ribbon domain-containing protein [Campylobacteraceae bacterium]|jgi:RNA polymerase subunit RPABC4/transcription elongation factor Spt4|nr:zinc ribbon domain-containing protein [Campylobacteraceae bacterium]
MEIFLALIIIIAVVVFSLKADKKEAKNNDNDVTKTVEQKVEPSNNAPGRLSKYPDAEPYNNAPSRLLKCPDCEKEVSKNAYKCPHCGATIKKPKWTVVGYIVIIITAIFNIYMIDRYFGALTDTDVLVNTIGSRWVLQTWVFGDILFGLALFVLRPKAE